MNLKNKVAFITGAAQGIGKETSLTLAKSGARIVAADLNLDLLLENAGPAYSGREHLLVEYCSPAEIF